MTRTQIGTTLCWFGKLKTYFNLVLKHEIYHEQNIKNYDKNFCSFELYFTDYILNLILNYLFTFIHITNFSFGIFLLENLTK